MGSNFLFEFGFQVFMIYKEDSSFLALFIAVFIFGIYIYD